MRTAAVCWLLLLSSCMPSITGAISLKEIVIVILSQSNDYHLKLAEDLRSNILEQAKVLQQDSPIVHLSHVDFPHVGGWTIIPLIPSISALHGANSSVVFFIEDHTRVNLEVLMDVCAIYKDKEYFIGYALHDNEPSIIHHFAFYDDPKSFEYPNTASGFAITTPLINSLSKRLEDTVFKADFNIDNSHELALFIWDEGLGVELTHEPRFCLLEGISCATHPEQFKACGAPVDESSIYFAVKTCEKFHEERVPVVQATWAKHAPLITFFSDVKDEAVPTVALGIPNTESGHCEKTMAIIRHVHSEIAEMPGVEWVVIADDDTILSVFGLRRLLSCYKSTELLALGERYGYGVRNGRGYNYITDPLNCDCPSISVPDDMYMGFCLRELNTEITHSPSFHQARPADYADGYLKSHDAVSFHKHWMVDPRKVYQTWFAVENAQARTEL